jgi:ABC-type Mn2+/Zn2+ transport system ATPase subunit
MTPAQPTPEGRLQVADLTVSYDGTPVLRRVCAAFDPGQVVGIAGPNGAGKSTLVKAILGLVAPDAGTVLLDGRPVTSMRRHLAYLPQRAAIDWDFPALVGEVVAMGRAANTGLFGRLQAEDRRRCGEALEQVGMSDYVGRPIGDLSGGQQQRVLFARALAQDAQVLLLDEPFTGVDALTVEVLDREIRAQAQQGRSVVVVNHDLATVSRDYDRLLLLAGRVVAFGPTAEVFKGELLAEAYGGLPPVGAVAVRSR